MMTSYIPLSKRRGFLPKIKIKPSKSLKLNDKHNFIKVSEIFPFLWLGNHIDAHNEQNIENYDLIINVTHSKTGISNKFVNKGIKYLRIPINDTLDECIKDYFDITYDAINKARINKQRVLVHCYSGISRSATIVIAFVMRYLVISFSKALDFVKEKRDIISPNISFIKQLMRFEEELSITYY